MAIPDSRPFWMVCQANSVYQPRSNLLMFDLDDLCQVSQRHRATDYQRLIHAFGVLHQLFLSDRFVFVPFLARQLMIRPGFSEPKCI